MFVTLERVVQLTPPSVLSATETVSFKVVPPK
jgi:hypothetical protein